MTATTQQQKQDAWRVLVADIGKLQQKVANDIQIERTRREIAALPPEQRPQTERRGTFGNDIAHGKR